MLATFPLLPKAILLPNGKVPTVAMAFRKFPALQKQTLPLPSLALHPGIFIPWEWLPHSGAAPFLPLSEWPELFLCTYFSMQRQRKTGQRKSIKKESPFLEKEVFFWACTRRSHSSHPPQGQVAGSLWLGRTSRSFARDWARPRGCAKEESSERQDWEAKIRWERVWQC